MEGAYTYRKNQYNHDVTKIAKIKKLVSGFVQSVLVFPVNFQLEVNT